MFEFCIESGNGETEQKATVGMFNTRSDIHVHDFRYAASYALERQKNLKFDFSYNATRNGRSGDDCFTLYQTCNEAV